MKNHALMNEAPVDSKAENPPKQIEPTPRPWKTSRPNYMNGAIVVHGNQIGDGATNDIAYCDGKNKEAHAELICRCVNNHDALLQALKLAHSKLAAISSPHTKWEDGSMKSIREVIAAAEKE